VIRKGKVLDEVSRVIKEESADILVVGDEGRTFAEKVLFRNRLPDNVKELERRLDVTVSIVR
jgi:hypothetical protein